MQSVENILRGLADDRATGSLRLGKAGTFYLTEGRVTYAESTAAPRVEDLLTASHRVSAHAVRQVRQAAAEDRWGGEQLVGKGVLTRGELEFCVLNAVLDATYFLCDATGHRPRFRQGCSGNAIEGRHGWTRPGRPRSWTRSRSSPCDASPRSGWC
jgi:hypothetical protein